ncbi:hypothetical protein GCM10023083_30380 [Streptomyces phyllanthi]
MADPLDIVWSRPLPEGAAPSTVTVSRDSAGRWYVSLLCEDPSVKPLPAKGTAVGIDVGLDHRLTLSTGEKITNPRHERRDRERLAKAQRQLSRKAKGDGANRRKARQKVAKIHARIADRRRDVVAVNRFFPSSKLCSTVRHPPAGDAAERPHLDVRQLRHGP